MTHESGYELVLAFCDQSPSYAHGFACGRIWQQMRERRAPFSETIQAELREDVIAMATAAGCSMGGCVAQAFAGLYPLRVSALGLIDTTAWYGEDAPKNWRERAATARSKGLKGMVEFQASRWFGGEFRTSHPEVVKSMVDIFLVNDVDCYAATCVMLGDADLRRYLPSLSIPVAVIVGEEDYATPVAMAQQLHDAIRGSTLMIIPGGRHLTPVECPDQIASQLLTLVQRVNNQTKSKF